MLALSLETAKTIAIAVLLAFVVMSIISAWAIKNVVAKLITVGLLVALSVAVWSQRSNLTDCADRAKSNVTTGTAKVTCTFFGSDVEIGV